MQEAVFQATLDNFQTDVIEQSDARAVVVLFYADQVPESAVLRDLMATLIGRYQGKAVLALSDVARDPTLAQQLRVQGLPSIRVVRGKQLVEQLDGPQNEQTLVDLLDRLTLSSGEMLKAELDRVIEAGDWATAMALLQQAINEEPSNQAFRVELADVLILKGEVEEARTVLADIPDDVEGRKRPQTRLEFVEEAAGLGTLAELDAAHQAAPDDLGARYRLAIGLIASGDAATSLEHCLEILRVDRGFEDDIGRRTMIRIFELLGKGSDLASSYRRRMFNLMH